MVKRVRFPELDDHADDESLDSLGSESQYENPEEVMLRHEREGVREQDKNKDFESDIPEREESTIRAFRSEELVRPEKPQKRVVIVRDTHAQREAKRRDAVQRARAEKTATKPNVRRVEQPVERSSDIGQEERNRRLQALRTAIARASLSAGKTDVENTAQLPKRVEKPKSHPSAAQLEALRDRFNSKRRHDAAS